jgi:hypothetical protein
MSPQVTAAIIAAGGVVLTVIATVLVQVSGRRATSRDTQKALEAQGKHLDKTLEEQGKQLDKTLAEQRTRTLNERFATAAGQLGSDKPPAVRLAGVYAMAGLADDWEENRQTCVDVLCAYLRMPYEPYSGREGSWVGAACLPGQPRSSPHRDPGHHRAPPSRHGRGEVLAGLGLRLHGRGL